MSNLLNSLFHFATFAIIVILLVCNYSKNLDFSFLKYSITNFNLALFIFIVFFVGFSKGMVSWLKLFLDNRKKQIAQDKRVEKFSVEKDNAQSRIKVLEAKIKTLEAALNKKLNQ